MKLFHLVGKLYSLYFPILILGACAHRGLMKKPKSSLFDIIGNKTRADILHAISNGPLSVGRISELTRIEQTNISHNLNLLMSLRIVERKVKGRVHEYAIREEARPLLMKLINEIRKNEDMLRKGGILLIVGYIIFRVQITGEIPIVSPYLISNMINILKPAAGLQA